MNVNFIAFGKLKERFFRDACDEHQKRLSAFAKVSVRELEPAFLPQNPSKSQIDAALEAEANKLRGICKSGYKIALCIEGKELSSEELAALLHDVKETHGEVCFVIGSSHGLAEKVKAACDRRLSFSRLTFPHRLMRVILSEALYRALSIEGGGKYHK